MSAAVKWGLITGMIYIIISLGSTMMGMGQGGSGMGMAGIGLLVNSVLFALTLFTIYKGVQEIRDNEMAGYITFGTAFRTGLKIAVIAGAMVGVFTILNMLVINPDAMEKMIEGSEENWENMSEDQAAMSRKIMGFFTNPYIAAVFSVIYVAFWGVIKSLIVGSMLKKDPPVTTPVV